MIVGESGILEKVDRGWNQYPNLESKGGQAAMIEQVIHENGAAGLFNVAFGNESVKNDESKFGINTIVDCLAKSASKETSIAINEEIMDCSNIEDLDTDVFNEQFCFSVEELQEPIDPEYQNAAIPDQSHGPESACKLEQNCGFTYLGLPDQEDVSANEYARVNAENSESKDGAVTQWLAPPGKKDFVPSDCNLSVSDLVWVKGKSHPWWPGQIFDVSSASEKAMRCFRNDSFLVACFSDRSFSWTEPSLLKPFIESFSEIEKTSDSESFQVAINAALNEVSKRVEFDLSCPCVGKPTHQIVDNAGIRTELISREGFLPPSTGTSLDTNNLIGYVKSLASHPTQEASRLDLSIAQSQLTSFYRFQSTKGNWVQFGRKIKAHDEALVPKPAFNIGDCIRRAASHISESPSVVNLTTDPKSFMYQLKSAAERPYTRYRFSTEMMMFFTEYRNSITTNDQEQKTNELPYMEACAPPKSFEFVDTSDTYWPDRTVQNNSTTRSRRGRKRKIGVEKSPGFVDGNAPAELVMQFPVVETVPSETNLNRMFRRFGPLKESDTEVDRDTNRARVVFKKSSDAEAAHGSASKFNIFGQTMVRYQLNYSVSVPFRSATNVEGFGFDDVALLLEF